jgi:5-methylcytosine-specific restriction endonuclease McrBC GTP-binding regulatory subunit McrB
MIILKNIISDSSDNISIESKNILFNWIIGKNILDVNEILINKIQMTLSIFSEETQFKLRNNNNEITFQQESIYDLIIDGYDVESTDSKSSVGPFRILKGIISKKFHPFLKDNSGFMLKDTINIESLTEYNNKVSVYLDLIPKRTTIENYCEEESNPMSTSSEDIIASNIIYFGSTGTGKSHQVNEITKEHNVTQITFHPEYDYNSFVGGYKPTMNDKNEIEYSFVPQAFTNIYIKAWKNYVSTTESTEHFYLQIEEINRGNCAEIFGDLFQLLDRDKNGYSKYSVDVSKELNDYLIKQFGKNEHNGLANGKIKLPNNLTIIATMNTSDQSLFPMDSAFKRRWDWEYVKIDYECQKSNFILMLNSKDQYNWLNFLLNVNKKILEVTQSQDKQIGNWFLIPKKDNKIIIEDNFINKVIFYLWNDVFKDEDETIFIKDKKTIQYVDFFTNNDSSELVKYLLEEKLNLKPIAVKNAIDDG